MKRSKATNPNPEKPACPLCTPTAKCVACRVRKSRGRELDGLRCQAFCAVSNPRMLRWHRFSDVELVLCANHQALVGHRDMTSSQFLKECAPSGKDRRRQIVERRSFIDRRLPTLPDRRTFEEPVEVDQRQRPTRRGEGKGAGQ